MFENTVNVKSPSRVWYYVESITCILCTVHVHVHWLPWDGETIQLGYAETSGEIRLKKKTNPEA